MLPVAPVASGLAFAYGFGKARALDARGGSEPLLTTVSGVLVEEALYRYAFERLLLRDVLHLSPVLARCIQAAFFGATHTNVLEAGLAGLVYSWLYEKAAIESNSQLVGFATASSAHLFHNLGVLSGAKS